MYVVGLLLVCCLLVVVCWVLVVCLFVCFVVNYCSRRGRHHVVVLSSSSCYKFFQVVLDDLSRSMTICPSFPCVDVVIHYKL